MESLNGMYRTNDTGAERAWSTGPAAGKHERMEGKLANTSTSTRGWLTDTVRGKIVPASEGQGGL